MDKDNLSSSESRKRGSSALQLGPRKRAYYFSLKSDPLVSHGRHFGRTVFALCNYPSLLTNGILRLEQLEEASIEDFPAESTFSQGVLRALGSEEELFHIGELIGKGAAAARGEDTKSLKPIIDWIAPAGEAVVPPLSRNSKTSQGFNHPLTGRLLCPAELDWDDAESCLLINIRFALCSSSVFSCTDTITDSEMFYHSLLDLLEDPDERMETTELLLWWNRQIFPTSSAAKRPLKANSALSKIRQKRAALKEAGGTA
ncbi:uncharacterized protein EDB91DRAFT_1237634 [Suillus paluster]|uniref:uncharacterized protein n=1 Tax=Suillus paluster TaxID=48578 RepID=UPI001B872CB3|nr:uncharacterized protein EDB91DRAFT_1237634 [Suillus paluster]KAG1738830.1 hypothetical protein EDB91DRAFT_1237634 [Suillus paluster]